MKLKHRVNIALYNLVLRGLNANTWITKRILGKKLFGRIISFDFDKTFDFNFPKNVNFSFIQIGGNDGVSFDDFYRKIIERQKKCGLILEPSPNYYRLLEVNYTNLPEIILLPYAIFENRGKVELFELNDKGLKNHPKWASGIGSVDINHLLKLNVKPEEISKVVVEGITFNDLLQMNPSFYSVDYLQIDTEGYDLEVLKSIDFDVFNVKIIKFEFVNLSDLEQKQAVRLLYSSYQLYRNEMDMVCLRRDMKVKCYF